MKTCGALLVLLCCCLAETQLRGETISENDITHQGRYGEAQRRNGPAHTPEATAAASTQQTCQPDIHTVLREMNAVLAEQRVTLMYTKTQMEAMETRMRANENKAETMETRLTASEKTLEEQRVVNKEMKEKLEEQAAAVRAVGGSVNLTGSQVEELRREREERRVSFSASLLASGHGNTGPFSAPTTLVYRHIITNIGNHYNPNTGIFTAPVRGVYHFVLFVIGEEHASTPTGIILYKNGEHVIIAYQRNPNQTVTPANAASLLLEVGDVVYVKLYPNAWVYDNQNHYTTFSGHLLFPM
ncbi:hypothetical protein ACEWY4_021310 [Coilia grayii]|uniref:C1q domain-containing protein n=1 Tax=Coilia grayii TaxID=363190 RepID=A0ABD1J8P9_9TELE